MKPTFPTRFAEILYALAIAAFGALHLKYAAGYKAAIPSFMPGDGIIWVYVTGIGFLLAALAIIINKNKKLACYLLALMLVIFILAIHLMPAINQGKFDQPLKDAGLAMAAIIIGNTSSK
jgi:putative oxidoreductase